jgi:hypothetical protein
MYGVEKLLEFLVILLLEGDLRLDDLCDALDPVLAEVVVGLVELVCVSLDIVEDVVGPVLSFLSLLEDLQIYELLVLLVDLIQAFGVEDVVQLKSLLCFSEAEAPILR